MNVYKKLIALPELTHLEGAVSIHQQGEEIFNHANGFAHRVTAHRIQKRQDSELPLVQNSSRRSPSYG